MRLPGRASGGGAGSSRMMGALSPVCPASAGSSETEIRLLNPLPRRDLTREGLPESDMEGTPFPARTGEDRRFAKVAMCRAAHFDLNNPGGRCNFRSSGETKQ